MPILDTKDVEAQQLLQEVAEMLDHIKQTVLDADGAESLVITNPSKPDEDIEVTGHDAKMMILGMKLVAELISVVQVQRLTLPKYQCKHCGHPQVPVEKDADNVTKTWCSACGNYDYWE